MVLVESCRNWRRCSGKLIVVKSVRNIDHDHGLLRLKGGRGSRSPSEFGGSLVDSDSLRLRELNRPKLSEVKFGIKRLMDDLGKLVNS